MALAIQIHSTGGPEVLTRAAVDVPMPAPGEVQIRQSVIGVNFIDIYHRSGLYPLPQLPAILGVEGAGVVEAAGAQVNDLQVGDAVAYAGLPPGGYAELRNLPASRAIKIPVGICCKLAGGSLLRGLTAHMLLRKVCPLHPGDFVLVHAGAGGLGQLLVRWAKRLGTTVIATVGSEAKMAAARHAGADHVLLHGAPDWPAAARQLAAGSGVHVAYDGIGGDTLARTFEAVRPFGTVASLGQAAGRIAPVDVAQLGPARSISLARPSVIAYSSDPALYRPAASELFAAFADGMSSVAGAEYPLTEASRAHRDLEAGRTTGGVILLP